MAFTAKYFDLATLVNSSIFQSRVTGAVANYAKYIIGEDPATALHTSRAEWAKSAVLNPQGAAGQVYWQVALDPAYSGQSATPIDPQSVTDATLDSVVQTAINNSLLKF